MTHEVNKKRRREFTRLICEIYLDWHKKATSRQIAEYINKKRLMQTSHETSSEIVGMILSSSRKDGKMLFKQVKGPGRYRMWELNR